MIDSSRYLALFLGTALAFQAFADDNLVGEYTGTLNSEEGYSINVGDPCVVIVGTSDLYGGSMAFEIRNVDKMLMETNKVKEALEEKPGIVKLRTRGGVQKPVEIVVMKLREDGALRGLMLKRTWPQQRMEKSAACGNLSRK